MSALAPTLQAFFTDRLMAQRQASPNTIAGYRDVFRLLLSYAAEQVHIKPCDLDIADLDAPLIGAFLNHLEVDRGNSVRTRNHRLAAIHSLFAYAALHHPEHAASVQRVLAIPPKRFERTLVTFLTEEETDALLSACDRTRWTGRRDHTMLLLALQTGLRISELNRLTCADVTVGAGANVHCIGKGRKERRTPLVPTTVEVLRVWLTERDGAPSDPLFPTTAGKPLSRDAIERRITLHATRAADRCPSIATKQVTAHTLRHSCAMRLQLGGVDLAVIALWLGHEQVSSTNPYLHADMSQKERAIARTTQPATKPGRYQAPDAVMAFLSGSRGALLRPGPLRTVLATCHRTRLKQAGQGRSARRDPSHVATALGPFTAEAASNLSLGSHASPTSPSGSPDPVSTLAGRASSPYPASYPRPRRWRPTP